MIIGGRRTEQNIPVICCGSREKVSVALAGTTWVTIKAFDEFTVLDEILAVVPSLTGTSTIRIGLFDADYLTDGQERWNSGGVAGNDTTDVGMDRVVVPGTLLRIKKSEAGTETVVLILYKMGI